MLHLDDIKKDDALINAIDWDMTPEEAVRLYLEWGNNWARSNFVIRSKEDVSHYFVVNTWEDNPIVYLIRRDSEQAVELAKIEIPPKLKARFLDSVGHNKGVYSIAGEIKEWLQQELSS